jgi:serine phosphatase RsbU (regulator of sigma subunit)
LERLQTLRVALAAASDEPTVAAAVIDRLAEPTFSGTSGIWLAVRGRLELELVAQRGMPAESLEQFGLIDVDADVPVAAAFREHRTVQTTDRSESELFDGLRGALRLTKGFVAVPLGVGGASIGALSVGYDAEPTSQDVVFLEAVAGQAAQAIARVRLAERERRRRAQLEFLAALTEAALSANSHAELMANVTRAAVPTLGDWCVVHYLPEDGTPLEVEVAHVDPGRVAWAQEMQARFPFDPDARTGVAAVLRSGTTELLSFSDGETVERAIADAPMRVDEARAVLAELRLTSVITVPLRTRRRVVGAIQFASAESGRHYEEEDVALAEVVAGRLAEPLDNAWVNDQHLHIAGVLQRALLPPRLPPIPGVDVAARYLPAGPGAVGGDFYDVFALGDGSWAILIGDACGKGPDAAALSSIARHTVRAAARHGIEPAEVMDWLNQAIALSDRDYFCTACYATLTDEGDAWTLRVVVGGHPLPIVSSGGEARAVGRHGTLLGVFPSINVYVDQVTLLPGDTVVFYTDGATDLPPPFDATAEEFTELVANARSDSANAMADSIGHAVVQRVAGSHRGDDLALVILRLDPARRAEG